MPRQPLLTLELQSPGQDFSPTSQDDAEPLKQRFYHYLPLCLTVLLILAPHPSLLIMLISYYCNTLQAPIWFTVHLLATYTLTFLAFSSLIVCVARDPGPVSMLEMVTEGRHTTLTEALMPDDHHEDDAFSGPGKWCRKCWAHKPERAHHCGICGRCVLKMDHHCPWLGSKCVGHRTYPAFMHFLMCITLLASYISVIAWKALYFAFTEPLSADSKAPLHELFLATAGVIFAISIGSFLGYHVYLVSTNQTTLENLSPFLILRHLPPLPQSSLDTRSRLSDPPLEHELTADQRRFVRDVHSDFRMYDIGWRANWAQVWGWNSGRALLIRIVCGGAGKGDGRRFPRNSRTEDVLLRIANQLSGVDKDL